VTSDHRNHSLQLTARLAALLCAALLATGCAEENPFSTAPISGRITYEDGASIAASVVTVHFVPDVIDEKHAPPGGATLGPDGSFAAASTFAREDGIVVGKHRLVLEATNGDFTPATGALPEIYTDPARTPLSIEVTSDGKNHFVLTIPRP
jgi:hypothetical protein